MADGIVASGLVMPGSSVFITSGSTVHIIGEKLIRSVEALSVWTNAIPLIYKAMELDAKEELARNVTMHAIEGELNPATGILRNEKPKKIPTDTLFFSPNGLTQEGLVNHRDHVSLQAILKRFRNVVVPLAYTKINAKAPYKIKHLGHMRKEIENDTRSYHFVLPSDFPLSWSEANKSLAHEVLQSYEEIGVKITKAFSD